MKRGSVVTGPADAEHRSLHSWHVLIRMSALRYKVMQAYTITIRTPPVLQRVFLAISVLVFACFCLLLGCGGRLGGGGRGWAGG